MTDLEEHLVGAWALITGAGDPDEGARGWIRDNLALEVEDILARRPDLAGLLDPAPPAGPVQRGDAVRVIQAGTVEAVETDGRFSVRSGAGYFYVNPAFDDAEVVITDRAEAGSPA